MIAMEGLQRWLIEWDAGLLGQDYFENTSSSRLEHAVVRYGGSGSQGSVNLYQSNVPVISSNIYMVHPSDLYLQYLSAIEGNTITNNGSHGFTFIWQSGRSQ